MDFYVPELFNHGLYYNTRPPMMIDDIFDCLERSKLICSKFYRHRISCLFWKNHPIERVCVVGLIVNHQWKEILKTKEEFVLITLDDCTSSKTKKPCFLVCKCSKELLISCGLQLNLSGNRVRVHGWMDFKYCEMQVEYLEIYNNIVLEIEHWKKASQLRQQMDVPWSIDQESLNRLYSQRDEIDTQLQRGDFVSHLEFEAEKNELTIASPHHKYIEVCVVGSNSVASTIVEREPEENANGRCIILDSLEIDEIDNSCNLQSEMTDVAAYNNTQARITFLQYLLECRRKSVSKVDLFQMRPISDFIDQITKFRFSQQNLANVKSLEQLKSETFFGLIDKLVKAGLLSCTNDNIIDIDPLKRLYNYCTNRLLALIKLKCFSGPIDYDYIKQKLDLPNLSRRAIVDIFKESLRSVARRYPRLLKNWWIDMNFEQSSIIHIEYQN